MKQVVIHYVSPTACLFAPAVNISPHGGETEIYAKQSKLETATLVSRMQMTKEVCVKYYTEKLFVYWLNNPQYSDHEDDYFGRIKCILA